MASYAHFGHRLVAGEKPPQNKGTEECSEDILSGSETKKKSKANEIKQIVNETKQIMSDSDDDVIKVKREAGDDVI
jgi:hypothetical protein